MGRTTNANEEEPKDLTETMAHRKTIFWTDRFGLSLLTDLYELTMAAGFHKTGMANDIVCFEYFFRSLPENYGYAIMAGTRDLALFLDNFTFEDDDIYSLRKLGLFDEEFLTYLKNLKLDIQVAAVPEGTVVFPGEPLIRVKGPINHCQLIESALLNFVNFQTLIATKASRICTAADGDSVLDMGLRRAQGPDGALSASRAAYIGGCSATSNVLAYKMFGIPVKGTMAHSWVMAHDNELDAFRSFANIYPLNCILLVDTYDTIGSGVPNAITTFKEMKEKGLHVRAAIRLDSGDLAKLSKEAYSMLVREGFEDPLIVASNDLDENTISDLKKQGAKINAWGVGTKLITSYNQPALGGVYKLTSVLKPDGKWEPKIKISSNVWKITNPGSHDLWRYIDADGCPIGDVITIQEDGVDVMDISEGTIPLTIDPINMWKKKNIRGAVRTKNLLLPLFNTTWRVVQCTTSTESIRNYCQKCLASLDDEYKRLLNPEIYSVGLSAELAKLKMQLMDDAMAEVD